MPRMDKDSKYYLQVHYRLSCGIPVGAKNTEAAKQFILLSHWAKLGTPFLDVMPREKNSCMKKYNYGDVDETLMTKERVSWLNQMLSMYEYTHVDMLWQSWLGDGYTRIPGEYDVYCGESWASCLAKNYPKANAAIKMHFR